MYHRYTINIRQNPIDGSLLDEEGIFVQARKVLIERFDGILYFQRDANRKYRVVTEDATTELFNFTILSLMKIDFPETHNYFKEYLREAFMQNLADKLSETHQVRIYNYNSRLDSSPNPASCKDFMTFMRNRFQSNPKLMKAAKKEYLKTIHGSDKLRNLYSRLEGGLAALI